MDTQGKFGRFDQFIVANCSQTKLPSLVAGLIENGKLIHSFAYGYRDIASKSPASIDTLYGVGSVTKSFTALAVGKLVEDGKVNFHDKIRDYLPLKQKAFQDIEIHHLLTHTSGIPGLGFAEALISRATGQCAHPLPVVRVDDVEGFLDEVDSWPRIKPGERMFYLNEGYYLLGDLISRVTQQSYEDYVTEEILRPLGMNRSYFDKSLIEADRNFATPYIVRGQNVATSVFPDGSGPAGGLVTNLGDLTKYIAMLVDGGTFEGKQLVGRDTLEKMETVHVKSPISTFHGQGYGYGLRIIPDFFGRKVVGHDGSVDVFTASFLFVPNGGYGIGVMANGTGYSTERVALYGMALLMDQDPYDLSMIRLDEVLKMIEGHYVGYKNIVQAEVRPSGSFLLLSGDDIGDNRILVPEQIGPGAATFFTLSGMAKMPVEFTFDRNGAELTFERYKYRKTMKPNTVSHNQAEKRGSLAQRISKSGQRTEPVLNEQCTACFPKPPPSRF